MTTGLYTIGLALQLFLVGLVRCACWWRLDIGNCFDDAIHRLRTEGGYVVVCQSFYSTTLHAFWTPDFQTATDFQPVRPKSPKGWLAFWRLLMFPGHPATGPFTENEYVQGKRSGRCRGGPTTTGRA